MKFWLFIDFALSLLGILGCTIEEDEPQRYIKAVRTLRLIFLIREIPFLSEPATHLVFALQKVSTVLIPAFLIIYFYAATGLFFLSGSSILTKIWNTIDVGIQTTNSGHRTGQCMKMKFFFVGKENAPS